MEIRKVELDSCLCFRIPPGYKVKRVYDTRDVDGTLVEVASNYNNNGFSYAPTGQPYVQLKPL